jgi:hypothetical protein
MRATIATTRRSTGRQALAALLLAAACGRADRASAPADTAAAPSLPATATVPTAAAVAAALPPPTPPAPPMPTPQTFSVVVPFDSEPTPTWARPPTPTPRVPTPTPRPSQCLDLEWWYNRGGAPLGSTLVEVEVTNRCGRDLDGMQVWFEVAGYRGGGLYQSVRGHLFDPLPAGRQGSTGLLLPCSTDWCDEIRVWVVDPLPP